MKFVLMTKENEAELRKRFSEIDPDNEMPVVEVAKGVYAGIHDESRGLTLAEVTGGEANDK